jgi:hypothetical protein
LGSDFSKWIKTVTSSSGKDGHNTATSRKEQGRKYQVLIGKNILIISSLLKLLQHLKHSLHAPKRGRTQDHSLTLKTPHHHLHLDHDP